MAFQNVNGIQIYYEEYGKGFPLVLINGLAFPMDLWYLQIEALCPHFRVIAMDNRGIGLTDQPDQEYTIAQMASDTAELLKSLGIEKAHVAGLSMGGFIAQQLTLTYPEMVDHLVLIATGTGGPKLHQASRPFWDEANKVLQGLKAREIYREDMILMTAPGFLERYPDRFEKSIALRLKKIQPLSAFLRQQKAAHAFDSNDRIGRILKPTMVILGDKDRLFPIELSEDFRRKLPNARFIVYKNCGHAILLEKGEELSKDILAFLKEG
jgi:pimeloyl-ACP methyl ester carboxylesterase